MKTDIIIAFACAAVSPAADSASVLASSPAASATISNTASIRVFFSPDAVFMARPRVDPTPIL